MKLYYSPGAFSLAPHVVLRWVGAEFEAVKADRSDPAYLAINPANAVPALDTGEGWVLTQAGAVLHYLVRRFPEAGLGGDDTLAEQAQIDRWSSFLTGDLHPSFFPIFMPARYTTSSDKAALDATREAGVQLVRKQLLALGILAEAVFRAAAAGLRRRTVALSMDTVEERLAAVGWRCLYGLGMVAAFTAGSIGAFLAFTWPPLLQEVVLTYLIVFLALRLTLVAGRIVLAPGAERFRLLPGATETARYWFVWSATLVGAFYSRRAPSGSYPCSGPISSPGPWSGLRSASSCWSWRS